ncbi:uncharacterized protein BDV14DRAFT_173692 [Aspergillus stella-maris]|uniref:uncharacterized protein n=1 Tax=Aspergillus stella-maris TaxID=1810926 RepID=UPI003CCD12C3
MLGSLTRDAPLPAFRTVRGGLGLQATAGCRDFSRTRRYGRSFSQRRVAAPEKRAPITLIGSKLNHKPSSGENTEWVQGLHACDKTS